MPLFSKIQNFARRVTGTGQPKTQSPALEAATALGLGQKTTIPLSGADHMDSFRTGKASRLEGETPKSSYREIPVEPGAAWEVGRKILGAGNFRGNKVLTHEHVSMSIIRRVIDRCEKERGRPLFSADQIMVLKDRFAKFMHGEMVLSVWNTQNIGRLVGAERERLATSVNALEMPVPGPVLNTADQPFVIQTVRQSVREGWVQLSRDVATIFTPACEAVRDTAQTMLLEQFSAEVSAADEAGLPFQSTVSLRQLAIFALKVWSAPIDNHIDKTSTLQPTNEFFGMVLFEVDKTELKANHEQAVREADELATKAVAENKARIARKQQDDLSAMDETRRAQVVKLNELHDALRAEGETARADRVRSRPVQEVRIIQ